MSAREQQIFKKVLNNGLTVIVRPAHSIPKVSIQLWYGVGSKDEQSGEKGLAHLLEHMIFKGTKTLSESDINMITHKLSGSCNAFTSYDYTGYLFDFPKQHWYEALPILADCMRNCTFETDLLNSELKAVIQELKMYKDDYGASLAEELVSSIFAGHPYQHPIIGYKHDLWSITRESLLRFYHKHYIPNNATLVVVGDVDPEDVFAKAQDSFGVLEPNWDYGRIAYNFPRELTTKSVTLYRAVQQPIAMIAYCVPGAAQKKDYTLDTLLWVLGSGRGSRLYKKLIDERSLVTAVDAFTYDLFDHGIFFIQFQPKNAADIPLITDLIQQEIDALAAGDLSATELLRATKQVESDYISLLENNQKQAYALGKLYLATGDEQYLLTYLSDNDDQLGDRIRGICKQYLRPVLRNAGVVLPLPESELGTWEIIQQLADEQDERVLARKVRETVVEQGVKVHDITVREPGYFCFPTYTQLVLANGIEVLYHHTDRVPKVDIIIELKTKSYSDPVGLEGLGNFSAALLLEGTQKYTGPELADAVESAGMSLSSSAGAVSMSMHASDLVDGLALIKEILCRPTFTQAAIDKVRERTNAGIKHYWDTPGKFVEQLVKEQIYGSAHPYGKNPYGTLESIAAITRKDVLAWYHENIVPGGTRIAIVGDIPVNSLESILNDALSDWVGQEPADIDWPTVVPSSQATVNHCINRDQTVLCFAGLSVARGAADYDALLIYDQLFGGGVLGSMGSRLFELREQSGLFYTIAGSTLWNAGKAPGLFFVKTIVSNDRLVQAEREITEVMFSDGSDITDEEFDEAKNALVNTLVDNFETNYQTASSFLFLRRYDLSKDYFDYRAQQLLAVTKYDVQQAVARLIAQTRLLTVRIGRV